MAFTTLASALLPPAALASDDRPEPRWGAVFVYDASRDAILLFGGATAPRTFQSDTWTWMNGAWQRHDVAGPSPRGFSAACYHEGRRSVIVHGGRGQDGSTLSDTWEWDGSRWHAVDAEGPYASDHHQMVYEPDRERLVAFGGWNGDDVTGSTWVWDGRWSLATNEGPPKRGAFAMAYDRERGRTVLCGGLWIKGQYADAWEWDGTKWTAASGPYDNSSLDHHAMVYDVRRRSMLVFGGKDYRYTALDATRTLTAGRLEVLEDAETPGPRYSFGMTYDIQRDRVVLFGGKRLDGRKPIPLNDVWGRTEVGWTRIELSDAPEGASVREAEPSRGVVTAGVTAEQRTFLESQVRAALDTFLVAFRDGAVEVLERMITANYMHCNSGSPIIGRDAWLDYNRRRRQQLDDGSLIVDSYETREIAVEIVGPEMAVLSGLNINRGRRNGEPYESIVRFTQTWVLQDGHWKRAAFHDTRQ